jgi:hypothetical protein
MFDGWVSNSHPSIRIGKMNGISSLCFSLCQSADAVKRCSTFWTAHLFEMADFYYRASIES